MGTTIAGAPVWHNVITTVGAGDPGNANAWIDPVTQIKDCLNFLKQRFTPFPDELLGAQNWCEGIAMGVSVAAAEAVAVCELDAYDLNPTGPLWTGGRRIFVANGNRVYSSARGVKWISEPVAGTPPTFFAIAVSNAAHINVMAVGDTTVLEFWTGATHTWSTITSPHTAHSSVIWQGVINRFLIGCSAAGAPHIVAYDETGGSASDLTMPVPAGYVGHLSSSWLPIVSSGNLASISGPNLTIACNGDTDGTVDVAFYYTPNAVIGTPWILSQPHLTTQSPGHSFFFDASRQLFFYVSQDGHIYSTDDAVTFNDLGYTVPVTVVGFGGVANLNTISCRGSFWFLSTEQGELLFSIDAGQTWTQVPAPFDGDAHDWQQYPMARTFALVDRFCVVGRASADGSPHQISFSLRLR